MDQRVLIFIFCLSAQVWFADRTCFIWAEETKISLSKAEQISLALKAETHFNNREYDESIAINEKLLQQMDQSRLKSAVLMSLSSAHLEKGLQNVESKESDPHFRKAVEYAQACYDMDPTVWRALANLGVVYLYTNNLKLSQFYLEQASRYAEPDSPYQIQLRAYKKYLDMVMNEQKT